MMRRCRELRRRWYAPDALKLSEELMEKKEACGDPTQPSLVLPISATRRS